MTRTRPPRRRPGTILRPMKRKTTHRSELAASYVDELRARVAALGFRAVARAGAWASRLCGEC